jgi:hypothetical protein
LQQSLFFCADKEDPIHYDTFTRNMIVLTMQDNRCNYWKSLKSLYSKGISFLFQPTTTFFEKLYGLMTSLC